MLLLPSLLLLLLLWLPTTMAGPSLVDEDKDEDEDAVATTLHQELGRRWQTSQRDISCFFLI